MGRRNAVVRAVCVAARRFRAAQECWGKRAWRSGDGAGWAAVPLWTLDVLVLLLKLCSNCTLALARVLFPPAMKSLHGETVLITGAGHGLGRELALQFAELGASVVCWDSSACATDALVRHIRSKDGECVGYTVDVCAREQVSCCALRLRRQLTDVSMLVVGGGERPTCSSVPLSCCRADAAATVVEVNLLAHIWTIQAFLPGMIERRRGHIVAINSSTGLFPMADMAPHCASHYGLRGLMESITEELRLDTCSRDINTTCVYLPTAQTQLTQPTHRFANWCTEITPRETARVIIEGVRRNRKVICIPSLMKSLVELHNLLPYRIRIVFTDFFNFGHRSWFCFC